MKPRAAQCLAAVSRHSDWDDETSSLALALSASIKPASLEVLELVLAVLVVVTGGAGFIGSATVELLLGCGDELGIERVVVVDNFYSGSPANLPSARELVVVEADVSRSELFEKVVPILRDYRGSVSIIHLAALVGVDEVAENPRRGLEVNVLGTLNVLELARALDAERVVYASSVAVYGEPTRLPIDEDHPLRPVNLYGLTKLFGEQLLWRYHEDYGLSVVALRYFNVYGPRMRSGPYAGVVHKFITALLRREVPTIYGDGLQTRDFVYVYDVAKANLKALQSRYVGAVNVGSGRETSILELYKLICSLVGWCPEPKHAPPRPGDVRRSRASIKRAAEVLGWSPETALESGLAATIEWYARTARAP